MRLVRHTNHLKEMLFFYHEMLDFKVIENFDSKYGYNGSVLQKTGESWQLEIVSSKISPRHLCDEEDLMILCYPSLKRVEQILEKLQLHKYRRLAPTNPFWEERGLLVKDPDGYRILLCVENNFDGQK